MASSSKLTPSHQTNHAPLQEAISALLPHLDSQQAQIISTSILRVLVEFPDRDRQSEEALQQTCNILRTYGADLQRPQLEHVHQIALNVIFSLMPSTRNQYQSSDLIEWNQHAAATFQQVVVTSHAGLHHEDSLPLHPTPSQGNQSSQPSSSFNPSWLRLRCASLEAVKSGNLVPSEMALSVHALLVDKKISDEAIQGLLFDAFAADFDAVVDVLAQRAVIQQHADVVLADCSQAAEHEGGPSTQSTSARPQSQPTNRDKPKENQSKFFQRGKRFRKTARPGSDEEDLDPLQTQPDWGASAFEARQKAFPGVDVATDSAIGTVDRVGLPKGSTRVVGRGFEEIFVPPPEPDYTASRKLIEVKTALAEHPELLSAMKGVPTLNRLQSAVYPAAFQSHENLLVCAPTGAGKTNVALLTIFREIIAVKKRVQRTFKVVYVAPMKALAAEVTEKFGKRLSSLNLSVREFTGDMSLSRAEALRTHVLVTTPEKWDVVTRKSGSELGDAVTLFIVDEIHLLHDERGAVLESIVARTLRLSETAQRQVRLVGLSATLPNYADVGSFMKVNPEKGLFHFDGSHRPVPLSQTFIGISEGGTSNSNEARRRRLGKMHEKAWEKIKDSLTRGHQAMIFVHSRKGTATAAREMLQKAAKDGIEDIFLGEDIGAQPPQPPSSGHHGSRGNGSRATEESSSVLPTWAAKEISKSRTGDIRELCSRGVGIHNAGLPRPDRKLVEKLFAQGVIRLLCCTATLAWGINLPARTVVILGTEVYNAEKGGFVQLGMLDVMQIFGRAGRPQFDTEGEGIILTMHEHLGKYLSMLTSSIPIESTLGASASRLADHLNAEIVSGTVSSIGEGVRWLSYTYLSVRMPQNPLVYGINWAEVEADSGLHSRRATLIEQASKALDDARMCRYDPRTGALAPTDLGRVSSHFYVSHETVVLWNELFSNIRLETAVSDQDWEEMYGIVIHAISCSTEFQQMRSRQEEADELDKLTRESCPIPLRAGSETREGKVSILLQAHISRVYIRMSDLSYVVQSATRLLRAFFEAALRKGFPGLSMAALELARASESRIWPSQHPLWQFTYLAGRDRSYLINSETVATIESSDEKNTVAELRAMSKDELSSIIRVPKTTQTVQKVLKAIPLLEIRGAMVRPLSRTLLRFELDLFPNFRWVDNLHGNAESWWLWVEDVEENRIYHSQKILLNKRQVRSLNADAQEFSSMHSRTTDFSFTVAVFDPPSPHYWIRIESDRWHTGRASSKLVIVEPRLLPSQQSFISKISDLRPIPIRAALKPNEADVFQNAISHFNPVQTQAFHTTRHTELNMLLCAPSGCGVWALVQLGMLRALEKTERTIVYMNPHHGALYSKKNSLHRLAAHSSKPPKLLRETDILPDLETIAGFSIIYTTPNTWCRLTHHLDPLVLMQAVSLFVLDEIHDLSSFAQAGVEITVAKLRGASNSVGNRRKQGPRVIALGAPVQNAIELAQWLDVPREKGLFSYGNEQREVPRESHVIGVAGDRYASRMYSMNRPVFSMIQRYSLNKPVLIFVSSRRQALNTAQDLLRLAAIDGKPTMFVGKSVSSNGEIRDALRNIDDSGLRYSVTKGIALFHDNLSVIEQNAVQEIFQSGGVHVLVCTFNMARYLRVQAHQVVIKGAEVYDEKKGRYEDLPASEITNLFGHAGRLKTDTNCYAVAFVHEPKKTLLKKFLNEPLPAESALIGNALKRQILTEISAARVSSIQGVLDWISWTFLYQRISSNPGYYQNITGEPGTERNRTADKFRESALYICQTLVQKAISQLAEDESVVIKSGNGASLSFQASLKGHIAISNNICTRSAQVLHDHVAGCESFAKVLDSVSYCEELQTFETGFEDDKIWTMLVEHVSESLCSNGLYDSPKLAGAALKYLGWQDSVRARVKLLCLPLFLGSSKHVEVKGIAYEQLHSALTSVLTAAMEMAAELGYAASVKQFVVALRSLYLGRLPTTDFWSLLGCKNKKLCAIGKKEGWLTIEDILAKEQKFSMFLSNNCTTAERTQVIRWVQNYPLLSLSSTKNIGAEQECTITIDIDRRGKESRLVETESRYSEKKEAGYVLLVCDPVTKKVISLQRIAEPPATGDKTSQLQIRASLGCDTTVAEIWIASDSQHGVEAVLQS